MKRAASALMLAASLCVTFAREARSQTDTPALTFEVASLKVSPGDSMGWSMSGRAPGQRKLTHIPLSECIKLAFDLNDYSLEGPAWLGSVRLDIVAKPPAEAAPNQFNQMLQALLVERFKIKLHRQTKMLNGFALVQESGGIKIHVVKNPEGGGGKGAYGNSSGLLWAYSGNTARLAEMLASELNAPVQDLTGSTEVFDYRIAWATTRPPVITADSSVPIAADPGPSLSSALREQLNLKLEKRKVPVSVLVIDEIERTPLEN